MIDVESEVDVGTSVFVYLPASPEYEIDNPIDDSGETPAFGTGKVLLMDDEEAIRVVAGDLLTLLGYDVEMAKDGSECIEMYKAAMESGQPFSVVIMDLTVPGGMGGKVAIQKLLEIDPRDQGHRLKWVLNGPHNVQLPALRVQGHRTQAVQCRRTEPSPPGVDNRERGLINAKNRNSYESK